MALLWISCWLGLAQAHPPGLSSVQVEPGALTLTFSRAELVGLGFDPVDGGAQIEADLFARGDLRTEGGRCTTGPVVHGVTENDGIALSAALTCPPGAHYTWSWPPLLGMEPGHRQQVTAFGAPVGLLDQGQIAVDFAGEPAAIAVAGDFIRLGVEHIWTGYDHLAFLLALVLVGRSLREMLLIVSGFTLAHSITLSAAALGVVAPPSALVEAGIAASILFAGVENLWRPGLRRRVAITFLLGLLHGFGFAGALAEVGLPGRQLLVALLSFNLGVELGQGALVAVALPLLLRLGRHPAWGRWGVPALSLGVAAMGLYWLVVRLSG